LDAMRDLTGGRGPTVVIVACGVATAQADALEMAAKGGRVNFFGGLPKTAPLATLNANFFHYKELEVSGSYSEKLEDFRRAVELVSDARFPAERIVTHELPLERMPEAFGLMESGAALKVCIRPS
ncbi:MAG: zinc-binding dehydrogenase, partial [bacterium]